MRPTGRLHLGHYYGVLKRWVELQNTHDCFYFVADWHALTTGYQNARDLNESCYDLVIEWLACGIDPNQCHLFAQSWVKEHSELTLLLSMITPLPWLKRIPSYKDQIEMHNDHSLDTLGFLSYPLLQAADILLYKASVVPVGEDQIAHIEFAREVARRFNFLYGSGDTMVEKTEEILASLSAKKREELLEGRRLYREQGSLSALDKVRALVSMLPNLRVSDSERLLGFVEGSGQKILVEPNADLLPQARFLGNDGKKMSKSLDNTLPLRSEPRVIKEYFLQMPTDPARKMRSDPGDPDKCQVWDYHQAISSEETKKELNQACRKATIGCVDCKKNLIESVGEDLAPIREKINELSEGRDSIRDIVKQGSQVARKNASETMQQIRDVLQLPR